MITSIYDSPQTIGLADPGLDIPVNQWWGIKAGIGREGAWQGAWGNLVDRTMRAGGEFYAEHFVPQMFRDEILNDTFGADPVLTAEQANKEHGIEGALKFENPIRESAAMQRRQETLNAITQSQWINAARHSALSWKGISGLGAQIAGQMTAGGIDFGLSIMPFVGIEKTGVQAAKAIGWRSVISDLSQGAIRIPQARLGPLALVPRFSEAVLNGATASAIGEILTYLDKRYKDEETNYLGGVATGALSAGALHFVVHTLLRSIDVAGGALRRLTPDTHETAAEIAQQQAARGEEVHAMDHATADESVIRESTLPDNAANANELLILVRETAKQPGPTGKIAARLVERFEGGERTVDVLEQMAALHDRAYEPSKPSPVDDVVPKLENQDLKPVREELFRVEQVIKELTDRLKAEPEDSLMARQLRNNLYNMQVQRGELAAKLEIGESAQGLTPQELADHRAQIESRPQRQQAMANAREARIQQFLDKIDPKTAPRNETTKAANQATELAKASEVPGADRWDTKGKLEKDTAVFKEQSAAAEADLKSVDPEAASAVSDDIRKMQGDFKDSEAQMKAALECLTRFGGNE